MTAPPRPVTPAAVAAGPAAAPPEPRIAAGTCYLLFAYDIGLGIDLEAAQRRITDVKQRGALRHKRRTPHYVKYEPAPLRVMQSVAPVPVGPFTTHGSVELLLFDFGAVSVTYGIPLNGPLTDLRDLSDDLYDHLPLLENSRRAVHALVQTIAPAITRPRLSNLVEDYAIYQIESLERGLDPRELVASHGPLLAQILRAERAAPSAQTVADALSVQLSYGRDDLAIIDWNAALLFDRDAEDVRAVLEFANLELLELRYLDDRLDEALARAYATLARLTGRRFALTGSPARELWRIAELQMDNALLFEGVNNALKLLGDQYLARLYRLVSERFHLGDWDASILRKLQTTESIYQKLADRNANRRMELLEWIIILLIALSILMPFIPGIGP